MIRLTFKFLAVFFMTAALAGFITGCGEEDDDSGDSTSLIERKDLEGTWLGECRTVDGVYGKTTYVFLDSTFSYQSQSYSTDDCSGAADDTLLGRGTYKFGGEKKDADGDLLANVDFTLLSFTWTFTADPTVADDWAAACEDATVTNGTVNVLGKTCENGDFSLTFAEEQFGSMWISEKLLYVTDVNSNGATKEERSVALNKTDGGLTLQVTQQQQ